MTENAFDVVSQDIRAAILAFDLEDFANMNIFANRAMSNALFGSDPKLLLPGFFIKDLSSIFERMKIQKEPSAFSTAKALGTSYLGSLGKLTAKPDLDEKRIWKDFHDFQVAIRKYLVDKYEEKAYSDNLSFTRCAFKWLISYLSEKREVLLHPDNMFLKGILNEMSRVFRVHSGDLFETYAMCLVVGLDRYYDYLRLRFGAQQVFEKESMQRTVFPYVDRIVKILSSDEINVQEVDQILVELIKGWREFFIEYMERPRPAIAVERGVQVPEEVKEKLTKSITESLERKIESEK